MEFLQENSTLIRLRLNKQHDDQDNSNTDKKNRT